MDDRPLPKPDMTQLPSYGSYEDVVHIMYGAANLRRAIITKDKAGLYRVRFEEWEPIAFADGEPVHWISASRASVTDTMASAKQLARRQIGKLTGR